VNDELSQTLLDRLGDLFIKESEKPVNRDKLSQLPSHKFSRPIVKCSKDDKTNCTVCLCDYEEGEELLSLPCFHSYHSVCIKNWMNKQDFCPICRCKI